MLELQSISDIWVEDSQRVPKDVLWEKAQDFQKVAIKKDAY